MRVMRSDGRLGLPVVLVGATAPTPFVVRIET